MANKESSRPRRVGEQMQRELAALIQREVKDPRIGMVTVNAVEVSRDLANAKVYVTSIGQDDASVVVAILQRAAGFLRRELARRMRLRSVPELRFIYDVSLQRGNRLSALIEEAASSERKPSED